MALPETGALEDEAARDEPRLAENGPEVLLPVVAALEPAAEVLLPTEVAPDPAREVASDETGADALLSGGEPELADGPLSPPHVPSGHGRGRVHPRQATASAAPHAVEATRFIFGDFPDS